MKNIEMYQIVVPIIAAGFLFYSVVMFRRGRSSAFELVAWSLIWGLIVAVALLPDQITGFIADVFGIKSNINALVFLALGILFFLQFHLHLTVRRQNQVISDLVRKLALRSEERRDEV